MDDLVKRLRAVSEFGGTHLDGLWSEAADRIEYLERELEEERHSRKVAAKHAWRFSDALRKISLLQLDPDLAMPLLETAQAIANKALGPDND